MFDIVGLWLNHIPQTILSNDDSIQELSGVILQGYRAQKMVVAGSALLITMMRGQGLPRTDLKIVANDLKNFLSKKRISNEDINGITLTSYDDFEKWEATKEQIIAAADTNAKEGWDSKPLEKWSVEDTLRWLSDNKLAKYCTAFKENDMNGQNIMEVNETDLRDLGIRSIGHRKTIMRLLAEAKKFTNDGAVTPPHPSYKSVSHPATEFEWPKKRAYSSVIVHGLSDSLLEDEDTLFDIENLAFTGFSKQNFKPTNEGIIVTFENPLKVQKKDELKVKFVEIMKRLMLDSHIKDSLKVDFWEDGKIIESSSESIKVEDEESNTIEKEFDEQKVATPSPSPSPPKRINYWKEFWVKLMKNADAEDFFEDDESKLNSRGAREVLATIRDVKLKEVAKDDPGIKHLKGFTQAEIEASLSDCLLDVMYEIENKKTEENEFPKEKAPLRAKSEKVVNGMFVEGLPRMITDDDDTVHGIESIVFKDVAVKHLVILTDRNPPALKVEFEKFIMKEKIPQLARCLKNTLKALKVDQKTLNDVTISFIEEGWQTKPTLDKREKGPGHKRMRTNDFLVAPGDSIESTRTFVIEGIPEIYLNRDGFLEDMPEKVFDGVPLEKITVPPAKRQPDGSMSQTSLEIRFKEALDMQQLPKIALKLKKFLKWKWVPPRTVNEVTLQVRHEERAPMTSDLEANPIVGIIFKGIPRKILGSNDSLYEMEKNVFNTKHPIRLMEPNEMDQILRITIENPIFNQQDLTTIAQNLKKYLAAQRINASAINDVLVMSFKKDKWPQNQSVNQPIINAHDYIGIEIENMPASIIDSDEQLEEFERTVLVKQRVVHMNVLDTTLKVSFGEAACGRAIETLAKQLKQFLSQRKIPIKQINNIVIAPHTKDTWNQS